MTGETGTKGKSGQADRRSGKDRRQVDVARVGMPERRRSVESRQPDVVELEMSSSEWGALGKKPEPPRR